MPDQDSTIALRGKDLTGDMFAKVTAAFRSLKSEAAQTGGGIKGAVGVLSELGALPILGTAGAGLLVKNFADAAGTLTDMSEATGISVRELQRLQYGAEQSGGSLEGVANAAIQIQKRLADGDKSAVGAVQSMGLSVDALLKMDPGAMFETIGESINTIPAQAERTATGFAIMGRTFATVAPQIKEGMKAAGDEAERVGAVMSDDTVAAGDALGDTWTKLKLIGGNLIGSVLSPFLPILNGLGSASTTLASTTQSVLGGFMSWLNPVTQIGDAMDVLRAGIQYLGLNDLVGQLTGPVASAFATTKEWVTAITGEISRSIDESKRYKQALIDLGKTADGLPTPKGDATDALEKGNAAIAARALQIPSLAKDETALKDVEFQLSQQTEAHNVALQKQKEALEKANKAADDYTATLDRQAEALEHVGLVTQDGLSKRLGDLVEVLNLAARQGAPALGKALGSLGDEFAALIAKVKAAGGDTKALMDVWHGFEGLAHNTEADFVAMERAIPTASLGELTSGLKSYNVTAEFTAAKQDRITEAFEDLGQKTPQQLRTIADAARVNYQIMLDSGAATTSQLRAAHEQMVEAINAADGKIPSFWQSTVVPGIRDTLGTLQTAVSGSFAQMALGAKGFRDGFVDIWQSIKASVLKIFDDIVNAFIQGALKRMIAALAGSSGGFSGSWGGMVQSAIGMGGMGAVGGGSGVTAAAASSSAALESGGAAAAGGGGAGAGVLSGALMGGAAAGAAGVGFGLLGKKLFGGAGIKAGGFGAAAGAGTGALIGTYVFPGIGTALGAGIGAIAGLISGWVGKSAKSKVNDSRDDFLKQIGGSGTGQGSGFSTLAGELAKLSPASGGGAGGGALFKNLISAGNAKDYAAALGEVQHALESTEYKTVALRDAGDGLLAQQRAAVAAGGNLDEVLQSQASSYSALYQQATALGVALPESLKPGLESLIRLGQLTDADGKKVGEAAGKFGEMAATIQGQLDDVNKSIANWDLSEKPEKEMGSIEKAAREALASQQAALEQQLHDAQAAQKQALADAMSTINQLGTTLSGLPGDASKAAKGISDAIGRMPPIRIPYRWDQQGPDPSGGDFPRRDDVPKFAAGGFVTRPTLGVIAEAGPEFVGSPALLVDMMARALRRSGGGAAVTVNVPVQVPYGMSNAQARIAASQLTDGIILELGARGINLRAR